MNNLRMIAIAMHNYNDANNQLPPAVVFSPEGQPLYSGYVLLLPYLEQAALFQQFDKSKAWNDPVNAQLSATIIQLFQDPASKNTAPGHADYLLVGGNNSLLSATKGRSTRFADCTDGTSNTIVVIESASGATSWAEPKTWDASQPISGNHRNVVLTALADGSVKAIPNTTPPDTLRRLAECNDGQPVNLPP